MTRRDQPRCLLLGSFEPQSAEDLAEALVVSDPWQAIVGPAAVVISSNLRRIALIGYFDAGDEARIEALRMQLDIHSRGSRFVDYDEAEAVVTELATRLVRLLGADSVATAGLHGIPRGGQIVLGMLAYALPASSAQLELGQSNLRIVVDDCAISGARVLQWLDDHPGREIVFAHLHSHPDLRRALERDPRIRACVAAADLVDHAPDRLGNGYDEWVTAWEERGSGVWIGQPDHLAYAWNEPDAAIWNQVTGDVERGWRLVGPRRCLKNRQPIPHGAVQVLTPAGRGELQPSPSVMWADLGKEVLLANVTSEEIIGLSGAGAAMWLAAIDSQTEAEALDRLSSRFDADATELRSDWGPFVEELVSRDLLIRS